MVAVGEELNEVGEAIVSGVQGPVPSCHEVYVRTPVLRDLIGTQLEPLHDLIPHRGVIHARLPGMADINETPRGRVPGAGARAKPLA